MCSLIYSPTVSPSTSKGLSISSSIVLISSPWQLGLYIFMKFLAFYRSTLLPW